MNFPAATNHFFDEINRFRRTAATGRIKRLVREKGDAQWRLNHAQTLFHF
jgi:hypothetical protein